MIVLVGLGNPGAKYENTKHNVGFITIDRLAEKHGISVKKSRLHAHIGEGLIAGKKVLLVKPQTFMNDSGRCVRAVFDYYDIELDDLAVIYDDVDLPVGTLRIRSRGSAGTHNGMRSIISNMPDTCFPRFRLGIGADRGFVPLYNYVLTGFDGDQLDPMRSSIDRCVEALETFIESGLIDTMQKFNEKKKAKKADDEDDEESSDDDET